MTRSWHNSFWSTRAIPGAEGFGTLEIHTWKAGDVPFLPEQAQLIADMWRQNLGSTLRKI